MSRRTSHDHEVSDQLVEDTPDHAGLAGGGSAGDPGAATGGPVGVSIVHDVRVPTVVAVLAGVLAVAWFARALGSSDPLDWVVCLVPAAVGALMLAVLRDARAPLMLADDQGVRVRQGVAWTGVRWADVLRLEVQGRPGLATGLSRGLRDGAVVVHLADPEAEALRVPLGPGTKVETEGLTGHLVEDLDSLSAGLVPVVVLAAAPVAEPRAWSDDESDDEADEPEQSSDPALAQDDDGSGLSAESAPEPPVETPVEPEVLSERIQVVVLPSSPDVDAQEVASAPVLPAQAGPVEDDADWETWSAAHEQAPEQASQQALQADPQDSVGPVRGLEPGRAPRVASRSDVVRDTVRRLPPTDTSAIPAQRRLDETAVTARLEDLELAAAPVPAPDPVIGPVVAAARQRARLTIDTLSERTRIRPHVLECLEVDDFEACGGDFYARGHLRTLARTFGLDGDALVATYDERYASPEIEAKQVFEAELASGIGGGLRAATTGPRWSMLAAAVLLLAGIWGAARVFSDTPEQLVSPAPSVVDSAGLAGQQPTDDAQPQVALGSIEVTADGASPQVAIRDGSGRILFADEVADGRTVRVVGTGPFDVTTSNGRALSVTYLGEDRGPIGETTEGDARRFG